MSKEAGVTRVAWIGCAGLTLSAYAAVIEFAHLFLGVEYCAGAIGAAICGLATAGWVWWMARRGPRERG